MLNADLLKNFLACPACKSSLKEIGTTLLCTNAACRRRYEVRDGIPVMLIDESTVVEPAEFERLVRMP